MLYFFAAVGVLFIVALIALNLWYRGHRRSLPPAQVLRDDEELREDGRIW